MTASFGQLVKDHRIQMGLTQQQLADLVGRSPSTIRSWERDRATPNDRVVLESVAFALGLDGSLLAGLAGVAPLDTPDMPVGEDAPDGMLSSGMAEESDVASVPAEPTSRLSFPSPPVEEHDRHDPDLAFKTPGPARSGESSSYLLETDRRPDSLRVGPERPSPGEPAESWRFEREQSVGSEPDPDAPYYETESEAEFEFDAGVPEVNVPEAVVLDGPTHLVGVDSEVELPGLDVAGLDDEPAGGVVDEPDGGTDEDAGDDAGEPTQILITAQEERLLGVATATEVEFVAAPRARPVIEPESVEPEPDEPEPTELIDRTPIVEPSAVAPTMPVTRSAPPVSTVGRPAPVVQQRTQTLEQGRPVGPDSYLEDPKELRGYRIRAALTTATLIAMLLIARWAWEGFRDQLSGILDTLTTGF